MAVLDGVAHLEYVHKSYSTINFVFSAAGQIAPYFLNILDFGDESIYEANYI